MANGFSKLIEVTVLFKGDLEEFFVGKHAESFL